MGAVVHSSRAKKNERIPQWHQFVSKLLLSVGFMLGCDASIIILFSSIGRHNIVS